MPNGGGIEHRNFRSYYPTVGYCPMVGYIVQWWDIWLHIEVKPGS